MAAGNGSVDALMPYSPTPVESTPPAAEVTDPTPLRARRTVQHLAVAAGMAPSATVALIGAVSEVVTNAHDHGKGPVVLRAWVEPTQIVVTIVDCGSGPADPRAGSRPVERPPGQGGLGLWLARQLCDDLVFGQGPNGGFTVRMSSAR